MSFGDELSKDVKDYKWTDWLLIFGFIVWEAFMIYAIISGELNSKDNLIYLGMVGAILGIVIYDMCRINDLIKEIKNIKQNKGEIK